MQGLSTSLSHHVIEKAKALDASDELSSFQEQFFFPQKKGTRCLYFRGNSLGLQPVITRQFIEEELENWKNKGADGHVSGEKPWVRYHLNTKKALAKLVGANSDDEVVAMNNLTTNLHLAMSSFYKPSGRRRKILIERGAFPSDFYAVHSQIANNNLSPKENLIELVPRDGSDYLPTKEIIEKIHEIGDELALVMFPGVQYYTGQFFNIEAISKAAHEVGAYVGYDLAHAIGNIPMTLHKDQVDFAVWCSYKYLNSGPGGVGGLFVHERHLKNKNLPRLSGWWGHDAKGRFKIDDNQINPIPKVDGWMLSNLNILSHAAHLASLSMFDEADISRLRAKSIKLTGFLEELLINEGSISSYIELITPSKPEERGCQLSFSLTHHGKGVYDRLTEKGVSLDWREPNFIRVAPVPLYNSFEDVAHFVRLLIAAFQEEC